MSARIGKQLQIVTPNKIGMLSAVTGTIAEAGVNIEAICAYACTYATGNKAIFFAVTSDNARSAKALKAKKFKVREEKVVFVELENKVGALEEMADQLKEAKIDLSYIYGTTCGCGGPALIVIKSNKDAKVVDILD